MAWRRREREELRVELTPMVDVVFLLLIFFMISTTFIDTPGITVELPASSSQVMEKEVEELRVYLTDEGELFIGEEAVRWDDLGRRLADYGVRAAAMTFVLLADRDARHGGVVRIMDAAREAGFGKLAIATQEEGR